MIYFVEKTFSTKNLPQLEKLYKLQRHTQRCQGLHVHVFERV